jgi:hypothetical protein
VALRDESFGALAYHYGTRRLLFLKSRPLVELVSVAGPLRRAPRRPSTALVPEPSAPVPPGPGPPGRLGGHRCPLTRLRTVPCKEQFTHGLDAPICLTWELTYACNLACVHCLSSSGRRDPMELTPAEARGVVDELAAMKVFYVNIGGRRADAAARLLRPGRLRRRPEGRGEVLHQRDPAHRRAGPPAGRHGLRRRAGQHRRGLASTNDAVRGEGSFAAARTAMDNLAAADFGQFKISVVVTRENVTQLDAFADIAESYGAQLRLTRFRPSGRGVDTWDALHPTAEQQRMLYHWLLDRPTC